MHLVFSVPLPAPLAIAGEPFQAAVKGGGGGRPSCSCSPAPWWTQVHGYKEPRKDRYGFQQMLRASPAVNPLLTGLRVQARALTFTTES